MTQDRDLIRRKHTAITALLGEYVAKRDRLIRDIASLEAAAAMWESELDRGAWDLNGGQ